MANFLPNSLRNLTNAVNLIAERIGRDSTIRQLHVLLTVANAGDNGLTTAELADKTHSSLAATSRNIRVLGSGSLTGARGGEGMGLLFLEVDPADSRRRIVTLTEDGVATVREIKRELTK